MPEIKHNFTGGKMNKDVDERLVPNGEYRDAINIQVSTSEGSEVGTIQNILGNNNRPWAHFTVRDIALLPGSTCVGSVSDEKHDAFYYFVSEPLKVATNQYTNAEVQSNTRNIIFQHKNKEIAAVFVELSTISIEGSPSMFGPTTTSSSGFPPNSLTNIYLDTSSLTSALSNFNEHQDIMVVNVYGDTANDGNYRELGFVGGAEVIAIDPIAGSITLNVLFQEVLTEIFNGQIPQFPFYVIVKSSVPTLNFHKNRLITGINIIDDLLFWTDNYSEPKKINILRSIVGTDGDGQSNTLLINSYQDIDVGNVVKVEEKHITVIRKAPKKALKVEVETVPDFAFGTTRDDQVFLIDNGNPQFGNVGVGSTLDLILIVDPNSPFPLEVDDLVIFQPSESSDLPHEEHQVEVQLTNINATPLYPGSIWTWAQMASFGGPSYLPPSSYTFWQVTIVSIDARTLSTPIEYNWSVKFDQDQNFKNKFPRFSYRYKYQDGEYSTFAPFTNVVFEPGNFRYDVKEAYNLGMENIITSVKLHGYQTNMPKDVASIDLLYKESNSPAVYTVDTLKKNYTLGKETREGFPVDFSYQVTPNQIRAMLPENQLLRAWDNVPRKSLAQEISGSRIIYGNYVQNYDLLDPLPRLQATLVDRSSCDLELINSGFDGLKSLKSIRNYSLGISYLDKYGRQTPVFTSKQADVEIPITKSDLTNQMLAQPLGFIPEWATHYKIFVKETSNEYYNLAMDRIYDAEDGNLWLSFPSSDRNKIDEETFLILKKGVEGAIPVNEPNKYKILAIENEAPEYIKTKKLILGSVAEAGALAVPGVFDQAANAKYFTDENAYPIPSYKKVVLSNQWDAIGLPLLDFKELVVRFTVAIGSITQSSQEYDVIHFEFDSGLGEYTLMLEKPIEEEWLAASPTATKPNPGVGITIYRKEIVNSPQFDGRFFVKVRRDLNIDINIISQASQKLTKAYQADAQVQFYYMSDGSGGAVNTTNDINSHGGALKTYHKWDHIYDSTGGSCWFIDNCYYAGYYAPGADQTNLNDKGIWRFSNSWSGFEDGTKTKTITNKEVPNSGSSGYNRGIYTVNGQTYIDFTFGRIKTSNTGQWNSNESLLHTSDSPVNDTASAGSQLWEGMKATPAGWCSWLNGNYTSVVYGTQCKRDGYTGSALWEGLNDWAGDDQEIASYWKLGSSSNEVHKDQLAVHSAITTVGQKFKFSGDPDETIYTIIDTPQIYYHLSHYNTQHMTNKAKEGHDRVMTGTSGDEVVNGVGLLFDGMEALGNARNRRITYRIPIGDLDGQPVDPTSGSSTFNPIDVGEPNAADAKNTGTIQFVSEQYVNYVDEQVIPENPAIWETEPKQDMDLDIYYEVDSTFSLEVNENTNYSFAPIGSIVTIDESYIATSDYKFPNNSANSGVIRGWEDNVFTLDTVMLTDAFLTNYHRNPILTFHRPDGSCVRAKFDRLFEPVDSPGGDSSFKAAVKRNVSQFPVNLSWYNCYSFGNGVESDRIRDDFNQVKIDKGAKASSTLDEPYEEERRKYGLIYSGLYNSISSVNNLNQFITAEKITKDINPVYGSIQKLHSRSTADGDLITLCEDRVLKILANKDAVFNADGNANLTATENVLGQAMPYSGEYGISKNPESFASESYRAYFTDKVRGAVMRLSKDGLTPISGHGMKDWFRDNLKLSNKLIGSYDDKKDEYNITLEGDPSVLSRETPGYPTTVSFREDVKGWVSFKSFVPDNAISCGNEYYSFKNNKLWQHHIDAVDRNNFYGTPNDSSFSVILNEVPGSVKSFSTLNYEGSDCRITQNLVDNEYYNLAVRPGWYVQSVTTDLERGSLSEFIEKEGKWFNYIKGKNIRTSISGNVIIDSDGSSSFDQASFAVQGLGASDLTIVTIFGCMDNTMWNFNSDAEIDDGSCIPFVYGCTHPSADNFIDPQHAGFNYIKPNTDDGSCIWSGCTDLDAFNTTIFPKQAYLYNNGLNIIDDGSCGFDIIGCTDSHAFNYNPLANTSCASCCIAKAFGCMDKTANNYDPLANTDNGTCTWYGCTIEAASNYGFRAPTVNVLMIDWVNVSNSLTYVASGPQYGIQDDGSCLGGGCTYGWHYPDNWNFPITDGGLLDGITWKNVYGYPKGIIDGDTNIIGIPNNYDANALYENGGCVWEHGCVDPDADNYDPLATLQQGGFNNPCIYGGCTNPLAPNYNPQATIDDGSCDPILIPGCMDSTACNYNSLASVDDDSCSYPDVKIDETSIGPQGAVTVYFRLTDFTPGIDGVVRAYMNGPIQFPDITVAQPGNPGEYQKKWPIAAGTHTITIRLLRYQSGQTNNPQPLYCNNEIVEDVVTITIPNDGGDTGGPIDDTEVVDN